MDVMQMYELNSIVKNLKFVDRNQREIERYQLLVNIQANSKHKIKIQDVMRLPWDDEDKNKGTQISEEQAQQLRERAKQLEQSIQQMTFVPMNGMGDIKKSNNE